MEKKEKGYYKRRMIRFGFPLAIITAIIIYVFDIATWEVNLGVFLANIWGSYTGGDIIENNEDFFIEGNRKFYAFFGITGTKWDKKKEDTTNDDGLK